MTDLTLITGFLGSGKTTLLTQLLAGEGRQRYIVLVNEFSRVDVDGDTVRQAADEAGGADEVVAIPGGSIFCKCLVATFVEQLARAADLAEQAAAAGEPFAGILVEASGMADPAVTRQMLVETKLDQRLDLRQIIALVDPGTFPKLIKTLPNIKAQVRAASLVLINKCDRHSEAAVAAVASEVGRLNRSAAVLQTTRCVGAAELLASGGSLPTDVGGDYAACRDPNYAAVELDASAIGSMERLAAMLHDSADAIYRAKGILRDADGATHRIDVTAADARNVDLPHSTTPLTQGQLVLIVAGDAAARFAPTVAVNL